jgi:small subunit ribosomal protein S4
MPKYIGPKCKLARREKIDLELKSGITSIAKKCDMSKKPGDTGAVGFKRESNYSVQLRTKQKLKRIYGMREKQFKIKYIAAKQMKGDTSNNLINSLESRLDNIVFRMGFAHTRAHARQIVTHKAILLNKGMCNIPSALVKVGDEISIRPKSTVQKYIIDAITRAKSSKIMPWLNVDYDKFSGMVVDIPDRKRILQDINPQLVVELYSGKK